MFLCMADPEVQGSWAKSDLQPQYLSHMASQRLRSAPAADMTQQAQVISKQSSPLLVKLQK